MSNKKAGKKFRLLEEKMIKFFGLLFLRFVIRLDAGNGNSR